MPTKPRKTPADIKSLARVHTESALKVLVGVMNSPKAPASSRVAAADSILNRGWGKAAQIVQGDEDNPVITEVKVTFVDS